MVVSNGHFLMAQQQQTALLMDGWVGGIHRVIIVFLSLSVCPKRPNDISSNLPSPACGTCGGA